MTSSDSCSPRSVEARDRGGLPCADRGERDRRAQAAGRRGALRARDAARGDGRAPRVHGAAGAGRARGAAARRVRGGGADRRRRLHGRAGAAPRAGGDRPRRCPLRHDGIRSAAPRAGELDLRADVLRLRVRAQVPRRPRPARQRRLLPARLAARAGRHGDELHVAGTGRRRLGDQHPTRRRHVPGAAGGASRAAARGHQGDDVPRGLRRGRRRDGRVRLLPRDVRGGLRRTLRERRPRRRPDARPEHRERARRGDRAELPGAGRPALADRGLRRAGPLPRRPRAAQGLPLRPTDDLHGPRRPDAQRAVGLRRWAGGRPRRVRPRPRGSRDGARRQDDARGGARRRHLHPHLRRGRLRPARRPRPCARRDGRARGQGERRARPGGVRMAGR